jgi:hypothetical protein
VAKAAHTVGVHDFERLREAAYVLGDCRLNGIPNANIGNHYFRAMGLNLNLVRNRHHTRQVNLVPGGFSDLERLVIRMPEFKSDRLPRCDTRVQG